MTAREAALKALGDFRRGLRSDGTASKPIDATTILCSQELSARDKALATRLYNGVLQNMSLCDFYISQFSDIGMNKLEPRVLDILRMSIYQIVFLTKIPSRAAVSEGVALGKKYVNPRASGFINAVLRKAARAEESATLPMVPGGTVLRLSTLYSHPEWLVRELVAAMGEAGSEELLRANNVPDLPMTAQVNTLQTNAGTLLASLADDGVDAQAHGWLDDCIELRGAGDITRLNAFEQGHLYIQDAAARLAVITAAPKPGDYIIDGCAAPGGKSFAAAIMMRNTGKIDAFDLSSDRLQLVRQGAKRLGISIIGTTRNDASQAPQEPRERQDVTTDDISSRAADIVLADVPCSGLGVIRKKPDIRYRSELDIAGLPGLQGRILGNLSKLVKPGGTLIYSTCTILRRENEAVAEAFLNDNDSFAPESFTLPGIGDAPGGMLTLWPHIHGTDGFFICKMRRRGGSTKVCNE